jgi:hypothetical protein
MEPPGSPTSTNPFPLLPDDPSTFSSLPVSSVLARIRAQKNSPLANQRLPAAILIALEDAIRESGESVETPGSHWAGLVSVLERMQGADSADETLAAVVYLFAAVFPGYVSFLISEMLNHSC